MAAGAAAVCAALAGCAAPAPRRAATATTAGKTAQPATAAHAALARAQATHEYSRAWPQHERASRSGASAVRAVDAFATAYINWNASTIVADLRSLAAASIGQARAAMTLAAADAAQDYELRRGGIANSGSVEAIAPLIGGGDRYAVLTRERTTAANVDAYRGLGPSWHVTIATVTPVAPGAWVLSGWQPES